MAKIAPDALDRWMYRKNGMDYGPFSSNDVLDLIRSHEVGADTEVHNRRTLGWRRVSDIPRFHEFLQDYTRKEAEEHSRQQMLHEVSRMERVIRRSSKLPYALGAFGVVAVGVAAFFLLRPPAAAKRAFPASFFRDLGFESLAVFTPAELAAMKAPPKVVDLPTHVVRKVPRPRVVGTNGGTTGVFESPEIEVSFDDEDVSGGRALSPEDLGGIQKHASPVLIRCFREEAARNPGFRGGEALIYVMPSGKVTLSRLATLPAPSGELQACCRSATGGLSVPPFAGAAQVMQIPVYVSPIR